MSTLIYKKEVQTLPGHTSSVDPELSGICPDSLLNEDRYKPWKHTDPYRFTPESPEDPWEECMRRVDRFNDDLCKTWKEDIDTLLVFAGLFSAAVTAFTVESYKWLQPDPASDTVVLLHYISQQIKNPTALSAPSSQPSSTTPTSLRINIFWFLSLIISLSSVLLGILCKQWIQEHRRVTYTASRKEALALSQLRDESFRDWHVPGLLAALPIMLQLALVLFFAGILELLWSLNRSVAAIVTSVAGLVIIFVLGTTILPAYLLFTTHPREATKDIPCPYKSPQSWGFYVILLSLSDWLGLARTKHQDWSRSDLYILRNFAGTMEPRVTSGLQWVLRAFSSSIDTAIHIFHCLQDIPLGEATHALDQSSLTRDALNFHFFNNLRCGWSPATERFVAELVLRREQSVDAECRSLARTSSFHFIENARFFDPKNLNEGVYDEAQQEDVALQTVAFIKDFIEADRFEQKDLRPLFTVCQQLWSHINPCIRNHSIPLMTDFTFWLSHTPRGDHSSVDRAKECAYAVLTMLAGSNTTDIFPSSRPAHLEAFIQFFKRIDACMTSHGIGVDHALSSRSLDLTWQEGKTKLEQLAGLSPGFWAVPLGHQ